MTIVSDALKKKVQQKNEPMETTVESSIKPAAENKPPVSVADLPEADPHSQFALKAMIGLFVAASFIAVWLFILKDKETHIRVQTEEALANKTEEFRKLRFQYSDLLQEKTKEEDEYAQEKSVLTANLKDLSGQIDRLTKDRTELLAQVDEDKKIVTSLGDKLQDAQIQMAQQASTAAPVVSDTAEKTVKN